MMKTGNNNSKLLDKFAAIASQQQKKVDVEFDINAILKNQPKAPTLQEIFADVVKRGGKNITRTAQFNPQPQVPGAEDDMSGMIGDVVDEVGGQEPMPGDDGLEGETGCDQEAVKSNLVEALIALCGSPEAACECIMGNGAEDGLPEEGLPEEGMDDGMGMDGMDDAMSEVPGLDDAMSGMPGMSKEMPGLV